MMHLFTSSSARLVAGLILLSALAEAQTDLERWPKWEYDWEELERQLRAWQRPCAGRWHFKAGQTMSPTGPGAAGGESEIVVEVHECGDTIRVRDFLTGIPDGQTDRDFERGDGELLAWRHETHARMPVVVSLNSTGSQHLVGGINIAGGHFTKPLELTLIEHDPALDFGCEVPDADKPELPERRSWLPEESWDGDDLNEALLTVMRWRGLTPPAGSGLKLEDYIHLETVVIPGGIHENSTGDGVTFRAYLRVGPDGGILPRADAIGAETFSQLCRVEPGSLVEATHWLRFKPVRHTDGTHDAFSQWIEARNQIIRRQQERPGSDGDNGMADAINASWSALDLDGLHLSDGRK